MLLSNTKLFHENRSKDVESLHSLLCTVSKNTDITILKSSIVLMLYNQVEGTFSNILCELFDYIIDEDINFSKLHHKIRKVYWEYYTKKISSSSAELEKFHDIQDLKNVNYLELNKYLKLYSGNLDARQIREISKKIGVPISDRCKGEKLVIIKNKRNVLAHGEVGFQEACRDISNRDLVEIISEVKQYLEMLIEDYENFIARQLICER